MVDLESKKKKLNLEKSRLENKEKSIREKERKLRIKKLIELGEILTSAGISEIDSEILFGAFVDIKEKYKDESQRESWKNLAIGIKAEQNSKNQQPLIISTATAPSGDLKAALKGLKFKWNPFRKEWYGKGSIDDLKPVLEPFNAKIESTQLF